MRRATPALPNPGPKPAVADPDQAWKALSLVNDWIKHAEAKTGASLAVAGVTGGVLFNLVKDQHHPGVLLWLAAVTCGAAVLAAGISAAVALVPRLRLTRAEGAPVNLLFFSDIARAHENDGAGYVEVLLDLTMKPEDLTRQIAHQVHANAVVAHRKFYWANWAVRALLVALLTLSAVAAIVGSA